MKCYKCGRDVQLSYYYAPDGIRFYCTDCWNQIIKDLENERNTNEVQSNR